MASAGMGKGCTHCTKKQKNDKYVLSKQGYKLPYRGVITIKTIRRMSVGGNGAGKETEPYSQIEPRKQRQRKKWARYFSHAV